MEAGEAVKLAKYVKNPDDPGKYMCPVCDYGHGAGNGKSRQSVSKHYNALHLEDTERTITATRAPKTSKGSDTTEVAEVRVDVKDDTPSWLEFQVPETSEAAAPTVALNPVAETALRGMLKNPESIKSQAELDAFFTQQAKMLRWVFAGGVDPVVAWWARSVTTDPDFDIVRSAEDWRLFEDVSKAWLEYRGIALPITPDIVFAGTVGSFYLPVLSRVRAKRDPSKPGLIKRWRTRRALRRALRREQREAEDGPLA